MGAKADRTRERIIDATLALVGRDGFAQTTIRAIAAEAGIAEGTIYRHFLDKTSILVAALDRHQAPVDDRLADRAGTATLAQNLSDHLVGLAKLRDRVLPLELAMLTDPQLQAARRELLASAVPPAPVRTLADYLSAEQRLGRLRSDIDPTETAMLLLALLFGLTMGRLGGDGPPLEDVVARSVGMVVAGLATTGAGGA